MGTHMSNSRLVPGSRIRMNKQPMRFVSCGKLRMHFGLAAQFGWSTDDVGRRFHLKYIYTRLFEKFCQTVVRFSEFRVNSLWDLTAGRTKDGLMVAAILVHFWMCDRADDWYSTFWCWKKISHLKYEATGASNLKGSVTISMAMEDVKSQIQLRANNKVLLQYEPTNKLSKRGK